MDLDNIQDIELLRIICKKYMVQMKKDYVFQDPYDDFTYIFKEGFWYPFEKNEYAIMLCSGDECEIEIDLSYSEAEEYLDY